MGHRDIKPENFVLGRGGKAHHIHLIDFGLSCAYFKEKHIPMRTNLKLTGTARYVSINSHVGKEQSRRDDLESVGHMLFYFLLGKLPWSGLDAKDKEEKYRKIGDKKQSVEPAKLAQAHSSEFATYLVLCRNLAYEERPDYAKYTKLFRTVRSRCGKVEDWSFQWNTDGPPRNMVPLDEWVSPKQPDENSEWDHAFNLQIRRQAKGQALGSDGKSSSKEGGPLQSCGAFCARICWG